MPTNKKESLIYTILMCCFMVYFMSVYNIMLNTKQIGVVPFIMAWNSLPLAVIFAFLIDWFIVSKPAKTLAFKLINESDSPLKKVVYISTAMIIGMVIFMSLFGALTRVGISSNTIPTWINNIWKNMLFALPLQLFIAGPCVRFLFRKILPILKI